MQAAEQFYYGFDLAFDFLLAELLESFLELVIHVEGNVLGSSIEFVHEILECHISCFLEAHIIIESI